MDIFFLVYYGWREGEEVGGVGRTGTTVSRAKSERPVCTWAPSSLRFSAPLLLLLVPAANWTFLLEHKSLLLIIPPGKRKPEQEIW